MLFLFGFAIVIASIFFGYTYHFGDLRLLWQPHEFLIILGAGFGAAIISNPWTVIKRSCIHLGRLFRSSPYKKSDYVDLLALFLNITKLMKSKGMLAAEVHIDNPQGSEFFQNAQAIIKDKVNLHFITSNMRLLLMGLEDPKRISETIEEDIAVLSSDEMSTSKAFLNLGDSLPALGIVAAVLGVIITMRSILEPPEVLGSMIAAALVGTFTGVLLSYGLFNPIGYYLLQYSKYKIEYLECARIGIIAYAQGNPPTVIVELMRKSISESFRPSFDELDGMLNTKIKN